MKTKAIFRDNDYFKSHGKTPKGWGSWAFDLSVEYGDGEWGERPEPMFSPSMTYTDAKKWAKAEVSKFLVELANSGVAVTGTYILEVLG